MQLYMHSVTDQWKSWKSVLWTLGRKRMGQQEKQKCPEAFYNRDTTLTTSIAIANGVSTVGAPSIPVQSLAIERGA